MLKNKLFLHFLISLILNFYFCSISYADKGIFNPKIIPDEIFTTDMPATITVTSEIGDIPMNNVKVQIYQTTKEGKTLNLLSKMHLSIPLGGFSGQFILNQNHESVIYFKIVALYNSHDLFESSILKIDIYEPLPKGRIENLNKDLKELKSDFIKYLKTNNLSDARQMVLRDAQRNPNITSANLNKRNLSIVYKGGISGLILLDDPNELPVDILK